MYIHIYTYIYYTISSCTRWPERVLVHVSQLNNAQGGVKPFRDFRLAECSFQGHIFYSFLNVLLLTESFLDFITNTSQGLILWLTFLIVLYSYASNFLGTAHCKCDSVDEWGTNCPYVCHAFVMQVMKTVWNPGIRREIGVGCAEVTRSVIRFKSAASSLSVKLLLMQSQFLGSQFRVHYRVLFRSTDFIYSQQLLY